LRRVQSWEAAPTVQPKKPPAAERGAAPADDSPELVYLDQFDFSASAPEPDSLEVDIDIDFDSDHAPPETPAELISQLGHAQDRERVIALLLRPPIEAVTVSVVLLPRGELVRALGAWGTPLPGADVRRLVLPLVGGSLLRQAFDTRQVICGPAREDAVQPMIASYLRVPVPEQACVAPVCVGDRVVNLLCYQSATRLDRDEAGQFARIAEAAAGAYRRLIVQHKRG